VNRPLDGEALSKVPEVTLIFWIVKVAATTLGETGGDSVTMTLNWGYLVGTLLFLSFLIALVIAQITAEKFHPFLCWATIVASTTFGTAMADFADRSLGIGYTGGSLPLFTCLIAILALWYWSQGTISVATVSTPKVEAFYWGGHHVLTDTRHRSWRLDRRHRRARLRRWRAYLRCRTCIAREPVCLDERIACAVVLGRFHPHASARRHGRRFP
jgi:Repeat of Unknown Function (DUF347)